MDIHFFFEGKLSREEATSAFLATLLEQNPEFRIKFFRLADFSEDSIKKLASEEWDVVTEEKEVDIILHPKKGETVILIENKVQPGSKTTGQVKKYYTTQIENEAEKNIVFFYIAPNESLGLSELEKTEFREKDAGYSISWDNVFDIINELDIKDKKFIVSGVDAVKNLIKTSHETKFECIGQRIIIDNIIRAAFNELQSQYSDIYFFKWVEHNIHQIYTCKSNVTLYLDLTFDTKEDPPYEPVIEVAKDRYKLNIRTSIRISARGKKDPNTIKWWNDICSQNQYEIIPGKLHELNANTNWFINNYEIESSESEIREKYIELARLLIDYLRGRIIKLN